MSVSLFDRRDFPLTSRLSYLNSAGIGLVPLPVQAKVTSFAQALGTEGTTRFFAEMDQILSGPRHTAARLFNAEVEDVAIVASASEAISQIAAWRRPKKGENVVLIDIDHPSPTLPWMRWAQEDGCEIRWVRVQDNPTGLCIERLAELVDENTAVISVSHVQWTTGYCLDLAELSKLARSVDALLVVDATHSAGVIPIDAPASGVDLIVTGSFKWLCAYSGTGACYLRREVAERLRPSMVGSRTSFWDTPPPGAAMGEISFPPGAGRLEFGSSAHLLRVAFSASVTYLLDAGIEAIAAHTRNLGEQLIAGAMTLGLDVLSPKDAAHRAGIVTLGRSGMDPDAVVSRLADAGVITMARLGAVRFAPHAFNNSDDIDRALEALKMVLRA